MNKKILIIDDDAEIVSILEDLVESGGYKALPAYDAEGGLTIILKDRPDLILLDLMLPKISGFEFARRIRANDETKIIPIIAVSALKRTDQNEADLALCDDYIEKPFDPKDLIAKIKKIIPGSI